MYFWNIATLVQELKENKIFNKDPREYIVPCILMFCLGSPMPSNTIWFSWLNRLLYLVTNIAGIYWCFKTNQRGDNKDFAIRMVSLSIPIGVRFFVVVLPLTIVFTKIGLYNNISPLTDSLALIVNVVFCSIFYAWIGKYIRLISNVSQK